MTSPNVIDILFSLCDLKGVKGRKSDRSHQELSNKCVAARIGVDVIETSLSRTFFKRRDLTITSFLLVSARSEVADPSAVGPSGRPYC